MMRQYGARRRRGGANPLGVGVIAVGSIYYVQDDAYFPEHHFTERFYRQLVHLFGHVRYYDRPGFWTGFFATTAGTVEFLERVVSWPCPGGPRHAWCDVGREIVRRLHQADLLGFYRARIGTERDAAEWAEFVRLRAKYERDTPSVDLGVLRTVLAVAGHHPTAGAPGGRDEAGRLALALGLG